MRQTRRVTLEARVFELELTAFLRTCEAVNTPRAMACYMLASNNEWDQYMDLVSPDPLSPSFDVDYLVSEAMRKNPLLPGYKTPEQRENAARIKWYEAEAMCSRTNELLSEYLSGNISFHPDVELLLTKTQQLIADILGPLTRHKLCIAEANFRFGPGSTSSCSGEDVLPSRKMVSRMDITSSLLPYYRVLQPHGWRRILTDKTVREVPGNKVTFVPKTAKTDRAIAVEPHMNIYGQLGIGHLIRSRLSKAGLDLDNGATTNRRRAGLAQCSSDVTIDLSSASDTIAHNLVMLLLPPDWFNLLSLFRSEKSFIDKRWVDLEKFSSMGNGYTFELESLIFWSLSRACSAFDEWPVVFGDDIICSRTASQKLIPLLKLLGFSINEDKTYLAGTFFESCGADYWHGVDVRPFYFKGKYADYTHAAIRVANKIRLYAHKRGRGLFCDGMFHGAWLFASTADDRASRTAISAGYGNDGLVKNLDESAPSKAGFGFAGWYASVWRASSVISERTSQVGAYLCALAWGTPSETSRLNEPIRGRQGRSRRARQYVLFWRDLGPWVG